ncbi:MAG: MFS transporter [Planctomycetia bacterium]|nr:MFS transporter [Planctomycetia bacterium]
MNKVPSYYRWELLLLLSLAFFFHQADRAIFGILLKPISESLHLSSEQMGLTGTVLFATLALMMPFAGYIGDRFSKKWIITICIIFWSAATAMTGLATGLIGLIFFRSIATAGGESFYAPSAYPMLAAYHKETRSFAMSVHQAALYLGVMSSGFLAGAIAAKLGWRHTFIIFGLAGVLLGIIFIFRLRAMPVSEEQSLSRGLNTVPQKETYSFWKAVGIIIRVPTFWLLTIGFSAIVCVNNAFLVWAPTFVQDKFEVSLISAGGYSMLYHHLAAFLGIMLGGVFTDQLIRYNSKGRLWIQTIAMLLGAPAIFYMGYTHSLNWVWIMMGLFGFFRGLYETNTHAAVFDVIEPKYRSTAVALLTMIAFWVGSCTPLLLGSLRGGKLLLMIQNWGHPLDEKFGLAVGFSSLSVLWVLGSLAVLFAIFFTFKRDRIIES